MLKEAETEAKSFFCDIFIIGSISIGGTRVHQAPSGYAYVAQSQGLRGQIVRLFLVFTYIR